MEEQDRWRKRLEAEPIEMLGRREPELIEIAKGGLLHDIGKRFISVKILEKSSKLDEEEMGIIRDHPRCGFAELCFRVVFFGDLELVVCNLNEVQAWPDHGNSRWSVLRSIFVSQIQKCRTLGVRDAARWWNGAVWGGWENLGGVLLEAPNCVSWGLNRIDCFGRGNNANHWAGEVDVFEAIADVGKRYRIDPKRIVLRGFSLGGAAAWHIALQYPSRFVAAEIGAGTWPRRLHR